MGKIFFSSIKQQKLKSKPRQQLQQQQPQQQQQPFLFPIKRLSRITYLPFKKIADDIIAIAVLLSQFSSFNPFLFPCSHQIVLNSLFWLGVNFTTILRAAFVPIYLRQKSTNLKCKYRKAAQKTFVQKSCS